ncbi:transporter substrate-binding domain-containing protein [Saccharospirillum impatiens]|uniref:transporter substrate-binding domain-containing protein n=1 Tax=Saccharospirillum impatiens TaxID=169438 RepID=UPI00048C1FA8|nr:transporter substrate-binding domain-containing protein [Saccharospirillum impatiens]
MRPVLHLLFTLIVTTSSHGIASDLQVLVTQFPPFVDIYAEDGGFAWSALTDFASNKGVTVTPVFRPTARIFFQIKNNCWQASLISIPSSTNVAEIVYSNSSASYGVFTSDPTINSLNNLRVAAMRTNSRSNFQKQLKAADAVIVEVDSLDQGYRMIETGRVDGVLGVGVDGVAIGSRNPEQLHMVLQLAVLPFILFLNTDNAQGREALRLLSD